MKRLILSAVVILAVSCSKDDSNNHETPNNGGKNLQPQTVVIPKKRTDIDTYNNGTKEVNVVEEESYEVVDNKVIGITTDYFEDNVKFPESSSKTQITYENNLPKSLVETHTLTNKVKRKISYDYLNGKLIKKHEEEYKDTDTYHVTQTYTYDGDKLIEIKDDFKQENLIGSGKHKINYISATQIQRIWKGDELENGVVKTDVATATYTLDAEKRVIKSVVEYKYSVHTTEYQYDDKNNFVLYWLTFEPHPEYFLEPTLSKNNLVLVKHIFEDKKTPEQKDTYIVISTYEYNDKGYPTRIVEDDRGNEKKSITEITY